MLKNAKNESKSKSIGFNGCSCCNTKQRRRSVKHSMKLREKETWTKEVHNESLWRQEQLAYFGVNEDVEHTDSQHIYDGERCIFCNGNLYDNILYDYGCVTREDIYVYTTETPCGRV